ncbi:MAG TPA: hypothetical protein VFP76_00980 [Gemmatimonadota bacterium]|nr:hypothetical protein [Gemmatimonadota bacterium]
MRSGARIGGAGLLAALAIPVGSSQAQDAESILHATLDRYEQRVQGIDDYTITYSFMGHEVTSHLVKRMVDGYPVFVPVDDDPGAEVPMDPYRAFPELAARAALAGTETIDGVTAHGLQVDDFEGIDLGVSDQMGSDFRPRSLTLWIDSGEYLLRRMDLEGTVTTDGQARPVAMTATLQDYRTVQGMPHPFLTTIRAEGAMAAGGASEEDLARAREQLAELDRQMADMPASQRKMMEQMMGPQIDQLRKMVAPGGFEMELVVTDLQVNTGPPAGS